MRMKKVIATTAIAGSVCAGVILGYSVSDLVHRQRQITHSRRVYFELAAIKSRLDTIIDRTTDMEERVERLTSSMEELSFRLTCNDVQERRIRMLKEYRKNEKYKEYILRLREWENLSWLKRLFKR